MRPNERKDHPRLPQAIAVVSWMCALVLVAAAVLLVGDTIRARDSAVDDAYITFRYAENLHEGYGLVWNRGGEHSEGYSNLLYVVLLALLAKVGIAFEAGAILLALAAALGAAAILAWSAGPRQAWFAMGAVVSLSCLLNGDVAAHASHGLETLLFGFLATAMTATLSRVAARPPATVRLLVLAAILSTLLFLCRPDGVLLLGVAWASNLWLLRGSPQQRPAFLAATAVGVAGLGYAAFKLAYFGYLLPNPYYMKGNVSGFAGIAETKAFIVAYAVPLSILGGSTVLATVIAAIRKRSGHAIMIEPALLMAGIMTVCWLGYGAKILHEIDFNHRFMFPIVPIVWFAIARGASTLSAALPASLAALLGTLVFAGVVGMEWPQAKWRAMQLGEPGAVDPYTSAFLRLGKAIADTGLGDQIAIACSHAGATPFASKARHYDLGGLTDNKICARTPPEERARYLETLRYDILSSTLFPASPGSSSLDEDPKRDSPYLTEWYLATPADMDASVRALWEKASLARRREELFREMRHLRDDATLLGEMSTGLKRWRNFVYVMRSSPHYDELVARLSNALDVPADRIDWKSWPK